MTDPVKQDAPDDLDAAYAEIRKDSYVFTWAAREWSMPHMADLDYRLLARLENHSELGVDELVALIGDLFDERQRQAWAQVHVPTPVLFLLFDRYLKHCGVKPGEEPASSDSSGSTGTSSRRTSDATTTSASPKRSTAKRAPQKAASPRGNSSP